MKSLLVKIIFSLSLITSAQSNYPVPPESLIPEALKNYRVAIQVENFPKQNHPVIINDTYYWKHATLILSEEAQIEIIEYGAYLYYNNTWNLRRKYPLKELDKTFGTKKQILLQGQPYVWAENWRVGESLFGGWAMWYFIGINSEGETVCGYGKIDTTDKPLN